MKNLYELLEVSETASNEIIEKAYKILTKKYHPDLQAEEQKEKAEQTMKQINEAYDILSNEEKRKEYDKKLQIQRQEIERKKQAAYYEINKNKTTEIRNSSMDDTLQKEIKMHKKMEQEIQKNMQAQYEQKYQEAYENYLRSLGYKIKYKWTWKNYKDLLITIFIIIIICAILWFFPPTHKLIIEFYESNDILKTIIDVIGNILVGIWNGICSVFR